MFTSPRTSLPGKRSLLSSCIAAASMALGLCGAPASQAAIVSQPASIVDHGSYITDTVNQRDWYKFSNPLNTIGQSMNGWLASNPLAGWSVASAAQVQGLEAQFGWTADTPDIGPNANEGLTKAMGAFLGMTNLFVVGGQSTQVIQAMTSDLFLAWNDATQAIDLPMHQVTTSRYSYEWFILNGQTNLLDFGDYVDADFDYQGLDASHHATGIWLSRATEADVDIDDPGCGRLAPCVPGNTVPEPGTALLLLGGLGAASLAQKRRPLKRRRVVVKAPCSAS